MLDLSTGRLFGLSLPRPPIITGCTSLLGFFLFASVVFFALGVASALAGSFLFKSSGFRILRGAHAVGPRRANRSKAPVPSDFAGGVCLLVNLSGLAFLTFPLLPDLRLVNRVVGLSLLHG